MAKFYSPSNRFAPQGKPDVYQSDNQRDSKVNENYMPQDECTLKQRLLHPGQTRNLPPLRVRLRTKTSKRCMDCQLMISKPEGKSSSIKFTTSSFGYTHVKSIDHIAADKDV